MHASLHQLLSLRDGDPVAADASRHVDDCAHCTGELARLQALRNRLQSLPATSAGAVDDAVLWERIRNSLSGQRAAQRSPNRYLAMAAAVVWAGVALVWFVLADQGSQPAQTAALEVGQADPDALTALVVQSQQLESYLQQLPRPRVEQAATAATVDALEGRIQWLDYALSASIAAEVPVEQSAALWQERIDLLGSLVTLRSAQAERLSF